MNFAHPQLCRDVPAESLYRVLRGLKIRSPNTIHDQIQQRRKFLPNLIFSGTQKSDVGNVSSVEAVKIIAVMGALGAGRARCATPSSPSIIVS